MYTYEPFEPWNDEMREWLDTEVGVMNWNWWRSPIYVYGTAHHDTLGVFFKHKRDLEYFILKWM